MILLTSAASPRVGQVKGVTLYVSDFRRPLTERLAKDFFSDPSQASVACIKTGPLSLDKVRHHHPLTHPSIRRQPPPLQSPASFALTGC
jgi:catabolite regulation protein CreA